MAARRTFPDHPSKDCFIRSYRDADFSPVCRLEAEERPEPYTQAVFIRQAGELFSGTFLVAEQGDEVIGYTIGGLSAGAGWILRLKVDSGLRQRGIGRALLEALITALEDAGAREILLSVSPANNPAICLYETFGFSPREFRPDYFGPGEDRIIMRRIRAEQI
ncbi:MAG: GNAT family N-acetyltransferase [Methanomicrobiales archaeon]